MPLPITEALDIAETRVSKICTVQEWAQEMKYESAKYFSRLFRNHYGERPKPKLIEIKLNFFFQLVENNPHASCYTIAYEIGLRDEIALNKFIKRHTGKSPTEWKNG